MSKHSFVTAETLPQMTRKWLSELTPFRTHQLTLKRECAALLVIDMQNYFIHPDSASYIPAGSAILPNVKKLITSFREAKRPVIYTAHVHQPDGSDVGIMGWWWGDMIREGHPEAEIYSSIAPQPGEKVIKKHRYSAFYNTDLETILRCGKIEDLVICGVMTNLCCESTARDAYYRDYRVFFMADANGAMREEMHTATLVNLAYGFAHIGTSEDILSTLKKK